jgi:hypothetical protein
MHDDDGTLHTLFQLYCIAYHELKYGESIGGSVLWHVVFFQEGGMRRFSHICCEVSRQLLFQRTLDSKASRESKSP